MAGLLGLLSAGRRYRRTAEERCDRATATAGDQGAKTEATVEARKVTSGLLAPGRGFSPAVRAAAAAGDRSARQTGNGSLAKAAIARSEMTHDDHQDEHNQDRPRMQWHRSRIRRHTPRQGKGAPTGSENMLELPA